MSWVKLDDGFFRNRKSIAAGKDGRAMYLAGLCYCAEGLTNGFIMAEAVRVIAADADAAPKTADKLVAVGYWVAVEGGYLVPDYLDFNPSRQQVIAERERARSRQKSRRASRRDTQEDIQGDTERSNGASSSGPVPNPSGFTSSSSSTSSIDPADDDVLEQALVVYVDRKLALSRSTIDNPGPWKRKVLANARAELAPQARDWLTRYVVTPNQLADALVAGGVPPSWNNCRKPA